MWSPLDIQSINDPYPMYTRLRQEAPVYQSQTGEWIISGYDDVIAILKDQRFKAGNKLEWIKRGVEYFKGKDQDLSSIAAAMNSFLLLLNPPQHTRARKFFSTVWNNGEVDQYIEQNLDILLVGKINNSSFDIVHDLARPLPTMTICNIMGIKIEDYDHIQSLGNSLVKVLDLYNSFKDLVKMESAATQMIAYFRDYIEYRTKHPENDLISKLIIANQLNNELLKMNELISICIFLFIAGQETTISLISTGLLNLAKHPQQREKLIANPYLQPTMIEELLRYDAPVHLLGRIANEDVTIKGELIKKDEAVTLCIASANRDEKQFPDADLFDIERTPNRHLAFGSGIHYCMGDWLAKRQGALTIDRFMREFPEYKPDFSNLKWNNNLAIRTLKGLPCRF